MKYSLAFLLLAGGLLVLPLQHGGWFWVLGWPAVVLLVIAGGYALRAPGLLGKRDDGTLRPLNVLLLLPYFAGTWGLWQVMRLVGREPCCDEVLPGLWIGRRPFRHELPAGTALVVDLTAEFPVHAPIRQEVEWVCRPTLDGLSPTAQAVQDLTARVLEAKGPVYVHCAAGHGRSATVLAGVLLRRGDAADVAAAEALMRAARPGVHLNSDQRRVLSTL